VANVMIFAVGFDGCPLQNHSFAGSQALLKHMRYQHAGESKAVTKRKELVLYQALRLASVAFEYQFHLPFKSCGLNSDTTRAFVDFVLLKPWGYILLECDEDQHRGYDPSCDVRRDFAMAASVALGSGHKLLIIRYNPDGYRVGGKTRVESQKDRMARLLDLLEHEPTAFERVFLCYDQDEHATLPQVAASWGVSVQEVSRIA